MSKKKHITIEANAGRFAWNHRGNAGWFQPNGGIHVHGAASLKPNVELWSSDEPLYSARIIVGFNVLGEPRWALDDVVTIVKRERKRQTGDPSSTFLLQRGLYTHTEKDSAERLIVDEAGAQVIIINTVDLGTGAREFQEQMKELAETLATDLQQESVILEIQKGGLAVKTLGIGPLA
jgi:hypothetical protein